MIAELLFDVKQTKIEKQILWHVHGFDKSQLPGRKRKRWKNCESCSCAKRKKQIYAISKTSRKQKLKKSKNTQYTAQK